MINDNDILKLQAHAVQTNNMALLDLAYCALGFGRRVQVPPLPVEVKLARVKCAGYLAELGL